MHQSQSLPKHMQLLLAQGAAAALPMAALAGQTAQTRYSPASLQLEAAMVEEMTLLLTRTQAALEAEAAQPAQCRPTEAPAHQDKAMPVVLWHHHISYIHTQLEEEEAQPTQAATRLAVEYLETAEQGCHIQSAVRQYIMQEAEVAPLGLEQVQLQRGGLAVAAMAALTPTVLQALQIRVVEEAEATVQAQAVQEAQAL